jgi:ATP-dependent DNA helicase RecQ
VRKWGHQKISTYGIGKEHSRPEWKIIGRELVRLGYLQQQEEKFGVLSLAPEGLAVLKERRPVSLTKALSAPDQNGQRVGAIACDEALFETLRQLRKSLADERSIPPYVVFSDVTLRQMARDYPTTEDQFARISGVGDRKLREFGAAFLKAIASHLEKHPRQMFAENSFGPRPSARAGMSDTVHQTWQHFRDGQTVEQIAAQRGLSMGTVFGHLADAILAGEELDLTRFVTLEQQREIGRTFEKLGATSLAPVFDALGGRYDYGRLKLVRAALAQPRA